VTGGANYANGTGHGANLQRLEALINEILRARLDCELKNSAAQHGNVIGKAAPISTPALSFEKKHTYKDVIQLTLVLSQDPRAR